MHANPTSGPTRRTFLGQAAADEGFALAQVTMVAVILFIVATTLLTLVVSQQMQSGHYQSRTRAVHMADAGINAYLYELRRDPNFWVANDELGPREIGDGTWQVWATPPQGDTPLTLRSVGTITSTAASRTVIATVRFPTFADYMFVTDADLNIGRDAVIEGKIRANGNVDNAGRVTGKVTSAGRVTGSGRFEDGYEENQPRVDFAQVTADLADIRAVAQSIGTYYDASGAQGYYVTVSGTSVRIDVVTGGTGSGNLTTTRLDTVNIPPEGVLYFNDTVWVSGTYGAKLTIASSRSIYIPDDFEPSNADSKFTAGLIASNEIIVPSWYPSMPDRITITAAMLAQNGAVRADMHMGTVKTRATIVGSMAYRTYSGFATYSGNTVVAGFRDRVYTYDPRLDIEPPPMYPQIKDGSLKVTTWIEQKGD